MTAEFYVWRGGGVDYAYNITATPHPSRFSDLPTTLILIVHSGQSQLASVIDRKKTRRSNKKLTPISFDLIKSDSDNVTREDGRS